MDIALLPTIDGPDIIIRDGEPAKDAGLETAVFVSLFSDRRDPDSSNPDDASGWWADALDDEPLGSRLWTLDRSKFTPGWEERCRFYCIEALEWLKTDGVASDIQVDVTITDRQKGMVNISGSIRRPGYGQSEEFSFNWDGQSASPAHEQFAR